jgi:aldehyde dehydrogenase (NAD+)
VFITAWNFPAAVPSWKAAPALVTGNTFILKPSELAPLSGKMLVDILNETGLPEGVAQVAMGAGDTGSYLVRAPQTRIVSITGSTETGREIATVAAANFKKCALELGGKNAAIVLDDADTELVANGLVWGAYGTAGQRCTSTSRLIIDSKVSKAVIDNLKAQASKLYTDKPSKSYAPIISAKQLEKIHTLVTEAIKEGAEVICGAKILDTGDTEHNGKKQGQGNGYFYAPTILRIKPEMRIARTEVFGPVLSVIELSEKSREATLNKALEIANSTDYGLSSSIYTRDINLAMQAASGFESGLIYINAPTIGAECGGASLFGGWKSTGNGSREGGVTALDTYTQYKTISIDYSGKLQRAQID